MFIFLDIAKTKDILIIIFNTTFNNLTLEIYFCYFIIIKNVIKYNKLFIN